MANMLFVLGGSDAEMQVIKALLGLAGEKWIQPNAGWGNHSYSPAELGLEIVLEHDHYYGGGHGGYRRVPDAVGELTVAIFVECAAKDWPEGTPMLIVDHHGERSGEPASVLQVVRILQSRTRHMGDTYLDGDLKHHQRVGFKLSSETLRFVELVAANDAGYIPAMLALGASAEEVSRIRALDRSAQGITPAHEAEADRAIGQAKTEGRLTVVQMSHSKTATVADRMFGRYDQLLILSGDGEVNFYGDGVLCANLKEIFEGWNGGSGLGKAGQNAFWGGYPNQDAVVSLISGYLRA